MVQFRRPFRKAIARRILEELEREGTPERESRARSPTGHNKGRFGGSRLESHRSHSTDTTMKLLPTYSSHGSAAGFLSTEEANCKRLTRDKPLERSGETGHLTTFPAQQSMQILRLVAYSMIFGRPCRASLRLFHEADTREAHMRRIYRSAKQI